jgi:hypothetical protein
MIWSTAVTVRLPGARTAPVSRTCTCCHTGREKTAAKTPITLVNAIGLHDLAAAGEPAAQRLRPRLPAGALGRTESLRSIGRHHHTAWFACPSKPLSTTYSPMAGLPTLGSPGWGWRRRAKKVSARGGALVLAGPKPKPVITPTGLTAISKWKPSYHPKRLLQPIVASPGNQPAPRLLASRAGMPELSNASGRQC